tara:strand:- start:447 stop:761 length:315 start_codon:yes stop_codon:yes gene_type:complete
MSDVTLETGNAHLEGVLKLHKQEESPTSSSDHGHVFAMEHSGSTHLYTMDSDGNETKISPHNQEGEWEYYCRNKKTGRHIKINMEKMIRKLEEITGETFIEIIE